MRYNLDIIDTSGTGATAIGLTTRVAIDGSSKTDTANMLIATFGDGYEQRATNGINSTRDKWVIQLVPLMDGVPAGTTYLSSAQTFYSYVGYTQWFWYTAMGESTPKKWRIDKNTWAPVMISRTKWSISFAITQCFDAGI